MKGMVLRSLDELYNNYKQLMKKSLIDNSIDLQGANRQLL
jgi:hypothetical protein